MTGELAGRGDRRARAILRDVERRAARGWQNYTRDGRVLESLRERMGRLLSEE